MTYDKERALADLLGDAAVAREALAAYGDLRALVGAPDAGQLAARETLDAGAVITGPADVHAAVWPLLAHEMREVLLVIGLDARNRIRLVHTGAVGSVTRCALQPSDVFTPLVRAALPTAVLVHNHPSGDPTPSPHDEALTRRVREAGRLLGVAVLDHVVVAASGYRSVLADDP